MPLWLRNSLVVLISILTFGMVTPAQASELLSIDQTKNNDKADVIEAPPHEADALLIDEQETNAERMINQLLSEAEAKSFEKFGDRIGPVIEDEFREMIFPNIEHVITTIAAAYPEEDLTELAITEVPSGGNTEKIFHIIDKNKEDIVRFHVRRDRPPHDGYWFNFHYHTYHDQFQTHYELGTIYWDKNTPPKWRS